MERTEFDLPKVCCNPKCRRIVRPGKSMFRVKASHRDIHLWICEKCKDKPKWR